MVARAPEFANCIAAMFNDAYSRIVPRVLGEQHECLLDTLDDFFTEHPNSNLLVIGPGGQALPYSCTYDELGGFGGTNRQRIKRMMGKGRIVLMDYVIEEKNGGLEKASKTLDAMGFFNPGFFTKGRIYSGEEQVDPRRLPESSISFLHNNARNPLKLTDESIKAVDANLSLHHASFSTKKTEQIYKEIFRLMGKGGLLHLGEGRVDMGYSEKKLSMIGSDLAEILQENVLMADARDPNTEFYVFKPGERSEHLPLLDKMSDKEKGAGKFYARVNNKGEVVLRGFNDEDFNAISNKMRERGYTAAISEGNNMVLPLIDPGNPADLTQHIVPVAEFYGLIAAKIKDGYSHDPELMSAILQGLEKEKDNAKKGLVEYYVGEERIEQALKHAGFSDITSSYHCNFGEDENIVNPFYNMTARKTR